MREDKLLAFRDEWQQSVHRSRGVRIYLDLANRPTLLGPNQLWVSDITYIRLACEYAFCALLVDGFSRKVVGWALDQSLKAQLPVCAPQRGIANRRPPCGVVHHSDQGVSSKQAKSSCKHCGRFSWIADRFPVFRFKQSSLSDREIFLPRLPILSIGRGTAESSSR